MYYGSLPVSRLSLHIGHAFEHFRFWLFLFIEWMLKYACIRQRNLIVTLVIYIIYFIYFCALLCFHSSMIHYYIIYQFSHRLYRYTKILRLGHSLFKNRYIYIYYILYNYIYSIQDTSCIIYSDIEDLELPLKNTSDGTCDIGITEIGEINIIIVIFKH